jgi:hypothetical protein
MEPPQCYLWYHPWHHYAWLAMCKPSNRETFNPKSLRRASPEAANTEYVLYCKKVQEHNAQLHCAAIWTFHICIQGLRYLSCRTIYWICWLYHPDGTIIVTAPVIVGSYWTYGSASEHTGEGATVLKYGVVYRIVAPETSGLRVFNHLESLKCCLWYCNALHACTRQKDSLIKPVYHVISYVRLFVILGFCIWTALRTSSCQPSRESDDLYTRSETSAAHTADIFFRKKCFKIVQRAGGQTNVSRAAGQKGVHNAHQ